MKYRLLISLLAFGLFSCSEEDQNAPSQSTLDPFATETGTPLGDAITKEIGPSGGALSSDDGILDLIVPPGAVSANTTFSIQAIADFCPGGLFAYRLLPEGLTFSSPVTLMFHFTDEDLSGTLPELLGIAYQGDDKIWYGLPDAVVDAAGKTISVEVKHFTDWTAIEYVGIFPKLPAVPKLRVEETIELALYGQGMSGEGDDLPPLPVNPANNPSPDEDDLPPLPQPKAFEAKWFVNGVEGGNDNVGTISLLAGSGNNPTYLYTAPSSVPANNPVLISVEITGLKKWTIEGGSPKVTTHNKVILFKQIEIIPDEYNYTLKIEYKNKGLCGSVDQNYYDVATMDVHVKNDEVTISNWENQPPAASPISTNFFDCTMTCDPGSVGRFNITSGSGEAFPKPQVGPRYFGLKLNHTALNTDAFTKLVSPDADPIVENAAPFEFTDEWSFVLADSAQSQAPPDGQYGLFATLTPK